MPDLTILKATRGSLTKNTEVISILLGTGRKLTTSMPTLPCEYASLANPVESFLRVRNLCALVSLNSRGKKRPKKAYSKQAQLACGAY